MSRVPAKPIAMLVLRDQAQEPRQLGLLARQVGVEEGLVALPASPQDVVRAVEPLGRLQHGLDLRGRVGEHVRIGIGGRTGRVARMAEQVGGSPQEPGARARHVALRLPHHRVEVRPRLREGAPLRRDVAIVEAVERHAQLGDELEGRLQLRRRGRHRVGSRVKPRPVERSRAEHVGAGPVEGVPQAHRDPELVLHPLAEHQAIGVVDLEREGIGRIQPGECDRVAQRRRRRPVPRWILPARRSNPPCPAEFQCFCAKVSPTFV